MVGLWLMISSVNDILEGWPSCVLWLASANRIRDRPSCDWWLASANGILKGWLSCVLWLALSANDILNGWQGCVCRLTSAKGILEWWPVWIRGLVQLIVFGMEDWVWVL
jgi:hypothetical protein